MDTTQADRDSLRAAQQKLRSEPGLVLGNLVEHKIQDPAKYKALSRQEQGLDKDARPALPKIEYKSKYLADSNCVSKSVTESQAKSSAEITGLPLNPEEVQANLWLNMDRVEFDKLEWMSDQAEKKFQEKLKASTHFDSQGKAIQPSDVTEQQQEVHDIESLVKLLDSTFQPQITYALNVVSKIATRATVGLYDAVFDESIHQVLIKECLLRARHHVDSANETICQSALKCLRALICNTQVDEIFIDKLFPLKSEEADLTMWLMTDQEDFEPDMKDNECVALDAILALFNRTDILKRFKYLLSTRLEPEFRQTYQDCILDILIRFARYSRGMAWFLNANEFPRILIDLFQPADIVRKDRLEQSLALRSLKFLRILVQASNELKQINCQPGGKDLKLPDSLVATITTYYHIDSGQNTGSESDDLLFKIHIETMRLMKSLFGMKLFSSHVFSTLAMNQANLVDRVRALTKLSSLSDIKSPSSLDWQYAAALIDLLGSMMDYERYQAGGQFFKQIWATYIRPQTMQWFSDLLRERVIPHQDISIALAVTVLQFDRCKDERSILDLHNLLLTSASSPKDIATHTSLAYFKLLLRDASLKSQLSYFSRIDGHLRDPVMLPSYGSMNFNTSDKYEYKLNSIVDLQTPYILLGVYFSILQVSEHRIGDLLAHYVRSIELTRYMRSAACYYKYPVNFEASVQKSVFAQQEIRILADACLFLSRYCIADSELLDEPQPIKETNEVARNRTESYSQLLSGSISIIGLINPEIEHMNDLKDSLLEKIVLNEVLHARLIDESRLRKSMDVDIPEHRFAEFNRRNSVDFLNGGVLREPAESLCLRPVFLNCDQPGRFWIFQPIIDYHQESVEDSKTTEDGRWFTRNIAQNKRGRPLTADCTDTYVIACLLKFHALILYHSPDHFELAVKSNIEEHLCLLGTIFLHDNLFLDKTINQPLAYNLQMLLAEGLRSGVDNIFGDASQKIVTLGITLMDFFNKLVDQYEAVSYCNVVFTNFLLLFITPKCDKAFRRILFSDRVETCLSQINIGPEQVWIPSKYITGPKESDPEVRTLIQRSSAYTVRSSYLDLYRRYHTS